MERRENPVDNNEEVSSTSDSSQEEDLIPHPDRSNILRLPPLNPRTHSRPDRNNGRQRQRERERRRDHLQEYFREQEQQRDQERDIFSNGVKDPQQLPGRNHHDSGLNRRNRYYPAKNTYNTRKRKRESFLDSYLKMKLVSNKAENLRVGEII